MKITNKQDKQAFKYVIKTLFDWDINKKDYIVIILEYLQFKSLSQLLLLNEDHLQKLMYNRTIYGKEYTPLASNTSLIQCLQSFFTYKKNNINFKLKDYISPDIDEFDNFRDLEYRSNMNNITFKFGDISTIPYGISYEQPLSIPEITIPTTSKNISFSIPSSNSSTVSSSIYIFKNTTLYKPTSNINKSFKENKFHINNNNLLNILHIISPDIKSEALPTTPVNTLPDIFFESLPPNLYLDSSSTSLPKITSIVSLESSSIETNNMNNKENNFDEWGDMDNNSKHESLSNDTDSVISLGNICGIILDEWGNMKNNTKQESLSNDTDSVISLGDICEIISST